jgi:ribosomal protein S18 acetylase RimI-like enzyme
MSAARPALKRVYAKAQSLALDLLLLRIPTSEHLLDCSLSTGGWSHVGTSIKMGIDRNRWAKRCVDTEVSTVYSRYLSDSGDGVCLRQARDVDVAPLASLITRAHRYSHFFNDPRLPVDGQKDLFPAWIGRSVRGTMDLVLVAVEKDALLGFASCLLSRELEPFVGHEVGVLDFVAVDPKAQGQGIGTRLLSAAFAWLFERVPFVELRTMLDNVNALRLYSRHGMLPVASDHHYHCWLLPAGDRA